MENYNKKSSFYGSKDFFVEMLEEPLISENCQNFQDKKESKPIKIGKGIFTWEVSRNGFSFLKSLRPYFFGAIAVLLIVYLPKVSEITGLESFNQKKSQNKILNVKLPPNSQNKKIDSNEFFNEINPKNGYTVNVVYGNIGPKLLESGAIDLEKMKAIYEKSGYPLTGDQLKILTKGSEEKIKISEENSYFLLNFLWALGLVNKNPILDEGPMMKYGGKGQVDNFASTGGWTLGKKPVLELYSGSPIIVLNEKQQKELEDFAYNSYRPCCNNSTAFADCNHGMAALALGEIMAASGASVDEMFGALKYFNAFWFSSQYFELAQYFKITKGLNWDKVDARIVVGKDYSTASGWSNVHKWLSANNFLEKTPSGGGSCGV